jgi:integrase
VFTLIAEFRSSAEFLGLAASTRKDYARYLGLVEQEFGDMPLGALSDPRARGDFMTWRDTMVNTPRKADFAYTVLARVFSFAKNRGRIATNPCERGGRLYSADRVDALWTEELTGRALSGLPPELRWAFVLALWTGQRQGDLLRLPWSTYDGEQIRLQQSKTGRRLVIPASAPLKAELDAIPRVSTIILTNTEGKPWTSDGFRSSWRKAIARLGITGLTFHDLRGSAVTRFAEAGATESEIAAITGHSHKDVGTMFDRHYLSRTNTLAGNAMRRLERMDRERKL